MAFCSVTKDNVENLNRVVKYNIIQNPESLKNFKDFTQGIIDFLLSKGVAVEKAVTLAKYIPEAVIGFTVDRANRDILKKAGVSIDAIRDVEDQFDTYNGIAKFLGLKSESAPIVVVNEKQTTPDAKIAAHVQDTKVEFAGNSRLINGKKYDIRVTGIAKVGFEDKEEDNQDKPLESSAALKHGNTVDAISKAVFDESNPKYSDFQDLIEEQAFDTLVANLKAIKAGLTQQGYIFRTAVTVYDKALSVSGEIDLVAITPEGEAFIMDFKTSKTRFNDSSLKNDTLTYKSQGVEMSILSKWNQYATQGYIYSQMLKDQLGITPLNKVGIIGINIAYDPIAPLESNRITRVVGSTIVNIPFSEVRSEFKGKTISQMVEEFRKLEGQSLGPVNEIKPRTPLPNVTRRRKLDRIAILNEKAATDPQLKQELDWFSGNPIGKDTLLRIGGLADAGILGQWTLDGITIAKHASEGTVYHEGWHRFSQVFMSQEEKIGLYKSVQKDSVKFKTRDGRSINTATADFLDVEEFLAEEFAKYAKNPSEYKYPTENQAPKTLFEKILAFIKRFFGISPHPVELFQKLYTGKVADYVPSVNNAFWGKLNSLALNRAGEEIVSNERFPLYVRSMDFLIGKQLREYKDATGRNVPKSFTAFKQSKKLQAVIMSDIFGLEGDLYKKYNSQSITDQQAAELLSIFSNKEDFIRAYLNATSYQTLKGFLIEEQVFTRSLEELENLDRISAETEGVPEDDSESEEDNSRTELFTPDANDEAAFSVADDAIQDFFRTIPKIKGVNSDKTFEYEFNELGFPENHTYYDVYYKTKKLLSGAFELEEMRGRMQDLNNQRLFPELSIINDYLGKYMDPTNQDPNFQRAVQNVQFIQAFMINMSMPEVPNMQLTIDYMPLTKPAGYYKTNRPIMVSFRTASRNLALKIVKTWEKNFKDRRNKTYLDFESWDAQKGNIFKIPLYKTEDGKIYLNPFVDYSTAFSNSLESVTKPDARKNGLKDFWQLMGVDFNPKSFTDRNAVQEISTAKNTLVNNLSTYKNSIYYAMLRQIYMDMDVAGVDMSNLVELIDYIKALPAAAMDVYVKEFFISNPVSFFNEKMELDAEFLKAGQIVSVKANTEAMRFMYEDLAGIEERFGDRVSSGSFRIEDKTKYPYYIPNQILMTTEMLNKLASTTQFGDNMFLSHLDPIKNKWMKRSYFMKKLFDYQGARNTDNEGNPLKIQIEDIASVRVKQEDAQGRTQIIERAPRSLLRDEKFFMDALTLFRAGAIEIPRAETSSTMFSIRLSDYGKGKILPITVGESTIKGTQKVPESFMVILKDYFAAEIEKRQWFKKNDSEVKGANKQSLADQFNIFEGILSKELKDKIVANLNKTPEEIYATDDIEAKFRDEVGNYFEQQLKEVLPLFEKLSKNQQDMVRETAGAKGAGMITLARAFVMNHFILSEEFYNLYFGDLYFYKNSFKRGKYVTNTGSPYYIDDARNEMLNGIQNSTMSSIFTGKSPQGKDFRTYKTGIINDVEMKSAYVSENDSENMMLQGIINNRIASGALAPHTPEYGTFLAGTKKALEKYNLINIADGQGIISLDFYRNFSIITNIWDENKEAEYERQKSIFRNHYDLYFKLDDKGNKVRMQGEELRAARDQDKKMRERKPSAYFNPLKVSHTGPLVADGPIRPVFDKFSVRPVIPEAAIGKRDEDLMMKMAEGDIDYLKFKSGSKVYQEHAFDWYKKLVEGEYDQSNFGVEEINPSELYSANLKHQLSTEGFKDQNIFGSQFRKIVFGVKYGVNSRFNQRELTYFTKLEDEFKGIVDELIRVEQIDLFSLLGVEQAGNTYRVRDMKKFIQLLQTESISRGVAVNNIDFLQYNPETGGVIYPIDYAFNRQQIQDLLSGMMDERLRRLKVNGSSLIQVSSAGNESKNPQQIGSRPRNIFKNPTEADIKKYGTSGLHYYHMEYNKEGKPIRTSTMGVKVAMSKAYESLFDLEAPLSLGVTDNNIRLENEVVARVNDAEGENAVAAGTIGTIRGPKGERKLSEEEALNRLNQALRDPEWRRKHIEMLRLIGYRIPTQNMNFIDNMEIMEFLPRSAGAIIIPPIELIVKSGSDFDIDKMNVIRPTIKNGRLVTPKKTQTVIKGGEIKNVEDTLEFINEKIKESVVDEPELKKIKKQLDGIIKGQKAEVTELESQQRRIRFRMLDIAIQAGVDDVIIDKLMENIKNKQKGGIIPENMKPDDVAFDEDDVKLMKDDYAKLVQDLDIIDKEIEDILAKLKDNTKEKGGIESSDLEWFNRKRDFKNSRNNDIVSILSQLMSHPYYFEHLVIPSSAAMFEDLTNKLMASQQNMNAAEYQRGLAESEGKLFDKSMTPREASTYMATLNSFDNLLSKRKDLGGYAIQRTFADIFNFVKLNIAREYSVSISSKTEETKVLYTPLIAPSDRTKVIQNGRILMHGESVSGIPIAKSFDELISLTVDLAGSPAYPKMGINNYNKKYVQYLIHQKVDPQSVLWFVNQPILKELFNFLELKKRTVVGYTLKHAITELALRKRILDNPQPYPNSPNKRFEIYHIDKIPAEYDSGGDVINEAEYKPNYKKANRMLTRPYWYIHAENLSDADYFSLEDMDKAIRDGKTDTDLQKKVLAYFTSITEEADELMRLEFAENVDTNKYATLTSLIRNEDNRRKIRQSGLFDEGQINVIEQQSMIAPFDYTDKAKAIYKSLFPKLYTNRTISVFSELITDLYSSTNIQVERTSKIIENDYIEYVYKNYGTYLGKNLSETFQPELINLNNTKDHKFFSDRLLEIKGQYPELLDIPFVDRLDEDVYYPPETVNDKSYKGLDNKEIHNIFFLRNPDNPTFEKNVYTNNWRNLINFDPERLGLKESYSRDDIEKISQFFHELIYFSLYQSGLTNTGNGFSDLIPYEHWGAFILQAFEAYDRAKAQNAGLEVSMLREFAIRFRQMNPKIDWGTKTRVLSTVTNGRSDTADLQFYKNYYRGKDYFVTDDDLEMSRLMYLVPDDRLELGDQVYAVNKPQNQNPFEPGVYVDYQGSTHILLNKLRSGIWHMYNIEDDYIVGGREGQITTLKDRGAVVLYGLKRYLVTKFDEIIDLDAQKKLNLSTQDRNRQNILKLAKDQQKPPNDSGGGIGPANGPKIPLCP